MQNTFETNNNYSIHTLAFVSSVYCCVYRLSTETINILMGIPIVQQSVDFSIISSRLPQLRMPSSCRKMQMVNIIWHQQRNLCMRHRRIRANRQPCPCSSSSSNTWSVCRTLSRRLSTISSEVAAIQCISNNSTPPLCTVSNSHCIRFYGSKCAFLCSISSGWLLWIANNRKTCLWFGIFECTHPIYHYHLTYPM